MIVVNLPSPSLYKQFIIPQPSWKQDISVTRRARASNQSQSNVAIHLQSSDIPSSSATEEGDDDISSRHRSASAQTIGSYDVCKVIPRSLSLESSRTDSERYSLSGSSTSKSSESTFEKRLSRAQVRLPRTIGFDAVPFSSEIEAASASESDQDTSKAPVKREDRAGPPSSRIDFNIGRRTVERDHSQSSEAYPPSQSSSSASPGSSLTSWPDSPDFIDSSMAPSSLKFRETNLKVLSFKNPALLTKQKTLEMYRASIEKTTDVEALYSFAIILIDSAQDVSRTNKRGNKCPSAELLEEARRILQRLADKSYPFAQYHLADGYASGLFGNGKPDNGKALPLFIAAAKHGHPEAGYRAGCCFELGWGTTVDQIKAIQFYRRSAHKDHLGAMARLSRAWISHDLGGGINSREGFKWLRRAAVSANKQYSSAPYDLGCLYETGHGNDIFRDETYAFQLFLQAANLGHAGAAFKLGEAHEFGRLSCQQDPALSLHFYAMAAAKGHSQAMFAICAWYMVGIDPILEIDELEAYEWARKAARLGLVQAQYAVGYLTEVGIGGRSDPLEANSWYNLAAEQGYEKAMEKLRASRNTAFRS